MTTHAVSIYLRRVRAKPMRVAYVTADPGVPVYGRKGNSVHVQGMLRALLHHGATVELFAASLGGDIPDDLAHVRTHQLPAVAKGDLAQRETGLFRANAALRNTLEQAGPFDLVYERYSLWSCAAMEWARERETPSILEVNAPLIEEQATHRGLVDRATAESVARRAFAAASVLCAVSTGVARYLEGFEHALGRVHVVPNGIDPRRFPAGIPAALPAPDLFTVGFLGTLKPWHGLGVLIEAFAAFAAKHPLSRLLIVGDGPERARLIEDAARHGLSDALVMTGSVPAEEVPQYIASMDVSTAPYPATGDFYFSPLKIYESMAMGVPVVASRIGEIGELIDHGVNGLLVPPGEAAAIAQALERLACDSVGRRAMGAAARVTVLAGHTWDLAAARLFALAGFVGPHDDDI